jgi:hypothetical protein
MQLHRLEQNPRLRFAAGDLVRVVVVNINPFLFKYRLVVDSQQVIQEANPADFLSLAFGIPAKFSGNALAPQAVIALGQRPVCPKADLAKLNPIISRKDVLADAVENLESALDTWGSGSIFDVTKGAYRNFVDATNWALDARLGAKTVQYQAFLADTLSRSLSRQIGPAYSKFSQKANAVADSATTIESALTAAKLDEVKCPPVHDTRVAFSELNLRIADIQSRVQQIGVQRALLDSLAPRFARVWTDRARFWMVTTLRRYDKSGDVVVTVERQPIPQPKIMPPQTGSVTSGPPKQSANAFSATISGTFGAAPGSAGASQSAGGPTGPPSTNTQSKSSSPSGVAPDSGYVILSQPVVRFRPIGLVTINAGLFYTPLPAPQFDTQQRRVAAPPGAPGDTLRSRISVADNSGGRVVPSVTLGLRLAEAFDDAVGFHLIFGATVLPKSGDVDFGLIGGAGLSVLHSKLMFVPGVYISKQNYLVSGYHVNDEIPVSSSTPVASHVKAAFVVGATYRIF